ncbi:Ribosomal RNA adenine dimethylase family protein [Forsythia ovata]|uniref:rRNA adenine N(6)-methyltransferase n=1 Tax=Forsythia ovata TaxID=205694 RepID=A0ABD1U7C8_9LAMI
MIHRQKSLSKNIYNPKFIEEFFLRHLQTKSIHGDYDHIRKKNGRGGGGEEGRIHLLKIRGQHLLTNPRVLESIVQTSRIKPEDTVLEIGSGTGNLTLKLLEVAKKVVAVEIDKRMVEILCKRAAEGGLQDRLNVICSDALKTDFPQFDLVVANIPYGISSPLLAKLVFGTKLNPFRSATLLLQKEFARRLLAKPGDSEFNRLSVNVKLLAEVEFIMDVSKNDFLPRPKVDSSVVKVYPKNVIPDVNLEEWWAFTRTCFNKKNKTLGATFKQKRKLVELMKLSKAQGLYEDSTHGHIHNNYENGDEKGVSGEGDSDLTLASGVSMSLFREKIIDILESGGFANERPSKLSYNELVQILCLFNQSGIYFHDKTKPEDASDVSFAAYENLL